ncbi:hypothetical protein BU25DRAFT_357151 [Macroventuria anomochaeta]|uniref:Uncharacterized protein n=1 Tax=Macroventuria anomochaeta TaxID=301207 RepID=A0ACB6SE84_9PLEO|nr:uncharacterized protein BU25DRAFT_357151 [Macroventuria anomochaeta]KAF2632600.1 hypothetical protein BU25DRAFT_357151 [Macroventuria anomochaeta]
MSSTSPVLAFAIRGTQALFAIVVFGLSTTLIRGHHYGSLPVTLGFVAFVGGLSFVAALLGIATHWMQALQGPAGVLMDGVIAGINIAGGILMAIKLNGVQCKSENWDDDWHKAINAHKMFISDIICGGAGKEKGVYICWWYDKGNALVSRCRMAQADSVFMFFTAIVVAVPAVLGFLRMKRGY